MRRKINGTILGIYDLILALFSIFIGIMMIRSRSGMFINYPTEWLYKVPFKSWAVPGIIAILLFGLGNIIAAVFSFKKVNKNSVIISVIMGALFFIALVAQVIILGEYYLATIEFFLLSILQLFLSACTFINYKKSNN